MTLILTCATPWYLLQVSDRLLTRRTDTPNGPRVSSWDDSSNKSVIFQAKNAVISLGYTGPGHVLGVPTDTWIVEKLSVQDVRGANTAEPFGHEAGGARRAVEIGQAIETLKRGWEQAYCEEPDLRKAPFQVSLCGWQWKHKGNRLRARPILHEVGNDTESTSPFDFTHDSLPRHWEFGEKNIQLSSIPNGQLTSSELKVLGKGLACIYRDPVRTVDLLIETIRDTAEKRPEVGSDCMVVFMPMPSLLRVEAIYVPGLAVSSRPVGGYSPWVVSLRTRSAPFEIESDVEIGLGIFTVYIRGAPPTASTAGWPEGFPDPPDELKALNPDWKTARTVFRMRSQPRRTWP